MGTAASKQTEDVQSNSTEKSVPTTAPILTPHIRKLDWDPRSPSSDIARTPIEVLKTPVARTDVSQISDNTISDLNDGSQPITQNILNTIDPRSPTTDFHRTPIVINTESRLEPLRNKNLDQVRESLVVSTPLKQSILNTIDPRSPTTEFHRTPIVIDTKSMLEPLHNKNLDKVREPLVVTTPLKPKKISEKVVKQIYKESSTKVVSPKLLESSPITIKPSENKRHSVVGLLETNIDFVETNLDEVIKNKNHNKLVVAPEILNESEAATTEISLKQEIVTCLKEESVQEVVNEQNAQYESEAPIIVISPNQVSVISPEVDTPQKISRPDSELEESDCEDEPVVNIPEYIPEVIKTDKLTKIINEVNKIMLDENVKTESTVNDLDRKLTNLIYEDKQAEASPKPSKPMDNNHTPLRDRNINRQHTKGIPQLKVSDKPTKLSGGASRIPVFKEKKLKGKILVQCENTPPRMKPKRSQWDPEDSIII